jgi:hypothetical protein
MLAVEYLLQHLLLVVVVRVQLVLMAKRVVQVALLVVLD